MKHAPERWLDGLRVLDLSRLLPGPFCTMLLADMGAEVIKVEDARGGDYARYYPPYLDEGFGAFFATINRNKRSIGLDLKDARGVALLTELAASADVLVESFRPGVMERLGCGHEQLAEVNPGLIYCAITGYGQDGPLAARAGHDLNYLALAGVLEQNGRAGDAPVTPGFQLADIAGGALYAALGVTSALYRRERTGQGAFVDVSMTEGALSFHLPIHATMSRGEQVERGQGMLTGGVPCYGVYETSDGRHLAVGSLEPKFWMGLVQALGVPELATDNLATGEEGARVRAKIAEVIAGKTLDEWTALLAEVDVCCEPILTPAEAIESELFRARQMFFDLQGIRQTRTPLTPPGREHAPAPAHGEHTDAVLGELRSAEQLEALRAEGVVK